MSLFRRKRLAPDIEASLRRWKALPEAGLARAAAHVRWVVVDVESSGLDPTRDALLAIGALAVRAGEVQLAEAFEMVLRQDVPSAVPNIEVHGIGRAEQLGGEDPQRALAAFLDFAGKDPLVAYHAAFDERLLQGALRERLGVRFHRPWLDLAVVAPLAWPGRVRRQEGLDGWLHAFSIPMTTRHRAIVDCLATAQLLLPVLERAPALGASAAGALLRLSSEGRWLGPRERPGRD